jgi:SPP1 gp7 family putative phage head morphogenesis protein
MAAVKATDARRRPLPKGAQGPLDDMLQMRLRREDYQVQKVKRTAVATLQTDIERALKKGTRGRWDEEAHAKVLRDVRAATRKFEASLSAAARESALHAVKKATKDIDDQWQILGRKATRKRSVPKPLYDREAARKAAAKESAERTHHVGVHSARVATKRVQAMSLRELQRMAPGKGPEVAKKIAAEVARMAANDAQRVISTEMTAAYASVAQHAALDMRSHYPLKKQWDAALDRKTCRWCASLHRTVVDVTDSFPGGVDGPPLHPFCRCAVVPFMGSWQAGLAESVAESPVGLPTPRSRVAR